MVEIDTSNLTNKREILLKEAYDVRETDPHEYERLMQEVVKLKDQTDIVVPKEKEVKLSFSEGALLQSLSDISLQSWNISELCSLYPNLYGSKLKRFISFNKDKIFRLVIVRSNIFTLYINNQEYSKPEAAKLLREMADKYEAEYESEVRNGSILVRGD